MKILMKFSVILFFTLISCSQSENKKAPQYLKYEIISDSVTYDFLNFILSHSELNKNIKSNYIVNKESIGFPFDFKNDSLELTKMNTIFNKDDIVYIFSQKKQFENFSLNPSYIKNKHIIPRDSIDNYKSFCTISFPLFNIKGDIVIIRTSYYSGALSSQIGTFIYQKGNSGWILIKTFEEAFS